jgi:hypothetical protein
MSINFTELGIPSPRTFITGYIWITILEVWEQISCEHPRSSRRSAAAWNFAHQKNKYIKKNSFWETKTSSRSDAAWYIFLEPKWWQFAVYFYLAITNEQIRNKRQKNNLNPVPCLGKEETDSFSVEKTKTSRRSDAAWYIFLNPKRWQFAVYLYLTNSNEQIENRK